MQERQKLDKEIGLIGAGVNSEVFKEALEGAVKMYHMRCDLVYCGFRGYISRLFSYNGAGVKEKELLERMVGVEGYISSYSRLEDLIDYGERGLFGENSVVRFLEKMVLRGEGEDKI